MPGENEGKPTPAPETFSKEFVEDLKKDNAKYRAILRKMRAGQKADEDLTQMNEQLSEEVQRLRPRQIPEGHVTLPKADVDLLESYRKSGKPEEIEAGLKKKGELEAEVTETKRVIRFDKAAKSAGFKPSLLTKLAKSENFDVEEREVTEENDAGEEVVKKLPYARFNGDDKAEWIPLSKFAEKHLGDFLPSLRDDVDDSNNGMSRQKGREFPRQTSSERSKAPSGKDAVAGYVSQTYVRPSERNKKDKD